MFGENVVRDLGGGGGGGRGLTNSPPVITYIKL